MDAEALERLAARYRVSTFHGETRTLFHVVDAHAPESEQPCVLMTFHDKDAAQRRADLWSANDADYREWLKRPSPSPALGLPKSLPARAQDVKEGHPTA